MVTKKYLDQLQDDIANAIENVPQFSLDSEKGDIWAWISREDELRTAPVRSIEEWTGISQEALPPHDQLDDEQLEKLYDHLSKMLDEYNMSIIFQFTITKRIKYQVLRKHFDQELPFLRWNMEFFDICPDSPGYDKCLMGELCQCRYFDELRAGFIEEDLTPEEERKRELEWEIRHIQKKYEDDWMKYYPYHLDPDYDDEYGNPYDYGFGDISDDDDDDDWWRK